MGYDVGSLVSEKMLKTRAAWHLLADPASMMMSEPI